jgi:hypothetical protein
MSLGHLDVLETSVTRWVASLELLSEVTPLIEQLPLRLLDPA